jgi:phospholipid/cholesterol/gamma-HCH transport system substrate-binding protein
MFKGDRNFTVGLFVSIAMASFIAFVIWLTGRTGTEEMSRYSVLFQRDVSGLAIGGPVKYMGMNIGSVVEMQLERGDKTMNVRVDIEILESTPVDSGTYASLAMQGITGVTVVNLSTEPGRHPPLETSPGHKYPVIPVRVLGLTAIMATMPEIMNKMDELLIRASDLFSEENQAAISGALGDVNQLTSALADNRESIAAIPDDLRNTLADIQAAVGQMQTLVTQVQPQLDSTMTNIRASSENLARMTERVDSLLASHEQDMNRFLAEGLGEVPSLMNETRQALRQMEKLLAELKHDPSQMIHRPPAGAIDIEP